MLVYMHTETYALCGAALYTPTRTCAITIGVLAVLPAVVTLTAAARNR